MSIRLGRVPLALLIILAMVLAALVVFNGGGKNTVITK
jgi:hypothetical protein